MQTSPNASSCTRHPTGGTARRWLARMGALEISIDQGQVFDTLDQGISAAQQGLGISAVDPVLASADLQAGRLATPSR